MTEKFVQPPTNYKSVANLLFLFCISFCAYAAIFILIKLVDTISYIPGAWYTGIFFQIPNSPHFSAPSNYLQSRK